MSLERSILKAFAMDQATWERHANPWSVWTRVATLPFWVLAIWSRTVLGWWALLPIGVLAFWTWFNPRLFPRPHSTDNWASKGVMGERVWVNRGKVEIPKHHRRMPYILATVGTVGAIF